VRFGELHVRPAISEYLARYEDARARLVLVDRIVDVIEEGIDVAVRIAPSQDVRWRAAVAREEGRASRHAVGVMMEVASTRWTQRPESRQPSRASAAPLER